MPIPAPSSLPTPAPTPQPDLLVIPVGQYIEAAKPATKTAEFSIINLDPLDQHWELHPINSSGVNVSCNPCAGDIAVNDKAKTEITLETAGLAAGAHRLAWVVESWSYVESDAVHSFSHEHPTAVTLSVTTNAAAHATRVNATDRPILGQVWGGLNIRPFDSDGLPVADNSNEDLSIVLYSRNAGAEVLCTCDWHQERRVYLEECRVPEGGVAGDWTVNVTLSGRTFHSERVRMQCYMLTFEDAVGNCVECVGGMICDRPGVEIATVALKSGYYRRSASTAVVRPCSLGEASCPTGTGHACAKGYTGALCVSCAPGYFLYSSECKACETQAHNVVPTILGIVVGALLTAAILRSKMVRAIWQFVWGSLRIQSKILLSTLQIVANFPVVLFTPKLLDKYLYPGSVSHNSISLKFWA